MKERGLVGAVFACSGVAGGEMWRPRLNLRGALIQDRGKQNGTMSQLDLSGKRQKNNLVCVVC